MAGKLFPLAPRAKSQNWYLSNNRIAGWGYDGRGNVTSIQYMPRGFAYDGENRQTAASINGANASYSYDGEGRRIKKNAGLLTATYVYDAFDHLIAEYSNQTSSSGTQYRHVDHLGSTRLVTSASATPLQCHDFLPFGGELLAGIDGRGSCFPSAPSSGIEFTGKERDGETGLDYFEARYMSAAQGRFTSADFPLIDQDPSDPQSWNLYAYVRNNPLKYTDPTGQDCVYTDDIDSNGTRRRRVRLSTKSHSSMGSWTLTPLRSTHANEHWDTATAVLKTRSARE